MRVNRKKRDELLRDYLTVVTSPTSCMRLGKRYTYAAVTRKEADELIARTIGRFERLGADADRSASVVGCLVFMGWSCFVIAYLLLIAEIVGAL